MAGEERTRVWLGAGVHGGFVSLLCVDSHKAVWDKVLNTDLF